MTSKNGLIDRIHDDAAANRFSTSFFSEDLEIQVCVDLEATVDWLAMTNAPAISTERANVSTNRRVTLRHVHSDQIVRLAIEVMDSEAVSCSMFQRCEFPLIRMYLEDELFCDYYPNLGALWLTNPADNVVTFVSSGKTHYPYLELGRACIELMSRHLLDDGWHTFHSGGVHHGGRTVMIVGDSGAGKTSLILALMAEGATYVSNERLFIKKVNEEVLVRSFPQAIGVGLGTAMHLPAIAPLVERPDRLIYPQFKFDAARVWGTPPDKIADLPDKLKILPIEFSELLGCGLAPESHRLHEIIMPQLELGRSPEIAEISEDSATDTLRRNGIPAQLDQVYPQWLPLHFGQLNAAATAEQMVDVLAAIPKRTLHYSFEIEHFRAIHAILFGDVRN